MTLIDCTHLILRRIYIVYTIVHDFDVYSYMYPKRIESLMITKFNIYFCNVSVKSH